MTISSHRLRTEEKKLFKKLLFSFGFFLASIFFLIYIGLQLFAKFILFTSSMGKNNSTTETKESTILFPPILDPTFEATNTAKINVSGFGEKETTVKIIVNDEVFAKVPADKEGKFIVSNISLSEGTNSIKAITIKDDKQSSPSSALIVEYIKAAPKLEIEEPSEGENFYSDKKNISITGITDKGNKVSINDHQAIVDQEGKFSYPVTLSEGDNNFKIIAYDNAGNQTTLERKVIYHP